MKQFKIILGLILFASVTTFAQSPRIKLNQITKDTVKGSVLISNPTDSGMVYSRDFYIAYGLTDTVLILYGDTLAATSGIISSVLSDGVTITGDGTTGNELKADTSIIATIKALNDSLATVSASTEADGVTITGDGSVGNPLKVDTLLISTIQGLVDTLTARGYLTAEVDGSITNEIQDISTTGSAGNISISSGSTLNLNVDDADASATNEGSLTVGAGTASTSVISSNTSGSTDVTLTAGSNITLSETGNNITIASTGGGTTYNNISENGDTVIISDHLKVDANTLVVDATNNRVGIGTTSPSAKLSVESGNLNNFGLDVNGYGVMTFLDLKRGIMRMFDPNVGSGATLLGGFGTSQWAASDGAYDPYFFAGDGNNLKFGTTVSGTAYQRMIIENDGDVVIPRVYSNTTGTAANVNVDATGLLRRFSSSIRYKTDIRNYDKGISSVMQLNPIYYKGINDGNNVYAGFIAEEIDELGLTEFVQYDSEGKADAISYSNMTALLTKAIQEQQAIIETQQSEIDQLKTLITDLTNRLTILENK